jgi:DNA-binding transcriptional ArsR family regulator
MHPFEVMGQPIRRRIVEILALGEHTAGTLEEIICSEYGVTRSAVQHHLAYFKRNGWVDIRPEFNERWYRLEPEVIPELANEVRALQKLWKRRYGAVERRDMLMPHRASLPSRRGRRGHGADPDDPWVQGYGAALHTPIEGDGGPRPQVSPRYV